MPWQAGRVGIRWLAVAMLLATTACTGGEDPGLQPEADATTDADCLSRIPDSVFATLGWTPPTEPAEATVRGCHRETEQGYVELRDRPQPYDRLCATLDRTGTPGPGQPVDWLDDRTACAVEPANDIGTTEVVVRLDDGVTQVTIAALVVTPQARVRAAVAELVD